MDPSRIRVVLLRTHHGQNLGAVARALKNFGLSRLVLAELGDVHWDEARRTAVRSEALLETAERTEDLRSALAGTSYAVGTSMRRLPGQRDLHPREVAAELAARSDAEEVALVFGPERVGLSNKDLLECSDVSVIPTSPQLPSLNLAQSVLLYAWELFQHAKLEAPPVGARADARAHLELEQGLRRLAAGARLPDPDRPGHGIAELAHTLKRAGLTPSEAKLWRTLLARAARGLSAPD